MKTDIIQAYSKLGLNLQKSQVVNSWAINNKNPSGKNFFAVLQDMKKETAEIKRMNDAAKKQRDAEKKTADDRRAFIIAAKIRRGERVSPEEMRFLMQADVFLYIFAKMDAAKNENDKAKYEDILKKGKNGELSGGEMLASLSYMNFAIAE